MWNGWSDVLLLPRRNKCGGWTRKTLDLLLTHCGNNRPWGSVHTCMKTDHDVLLLATRLVDELGETALRISRVRLVELTAANNLRAAAFWRDVLHTSEELLAAKPSSVATSNAGFGERLIAS